MTDQTRERKFDRSPRIVIDGSYLRGQALDAMRTFSAPLFGVFAAATGMKATVTTESPKQEKRA